MMVNTEESTNTIGNALDSLSEVLVQADKALAAYMEAQRAAIRKYREHELEVEKSYKEAERQANSVYEQIVEQAATSRAEAERQAEITYQETIEQAVKANDEKIIQALKVRDKDIEQAWVAREKAMEKVWKIFSREEEFQESHWDPDEGLELKEEVIQRLKAHQVSKKTRISMEQVAKKHGFGLK